MKRILLRSIPDAHNPSDSFEYRQMVEQVVRIPQNRQAGASIDEIRRGVRVLDALDTAWGGVLTLEDADWQHLCDKVQSMSWGMIDRRVLAFVDDVLNATEDAEVDAVPSNGLVTA